MSRSADYAIKGFLYQFNKTLIEILASNDDEIVTAEGIVEDIEVQSPVGTTAIQCKYHETSEALAPSRVYKPLLQMMLHFQCNPSAQVNYKLFVYVAGGRDQISREVASSMLRAALASSNKDLDRYTAFLRGRIDVEAFLQRFTVEFGPTYETLASQAAGALKAAGIPASDVDTLAYPNAVQMIAEISARHDASERSISRSEFLQKLDAIRKTAISRWTLALRSRRQLLQARRRQLRQSLNINARFRGIVIDAPSIDDYSDSIVLFIQDYLEKYHSKPAHICTPICCLITSTEDFNDVIYRLHKKGITCCDGYVGGKWDQACFLRDPIRQGRSGELRREFALRLVRWEDHGAVLDSINCDDLFVIGDRNAFSICLGDVNVEHLEVSSLKEARYLMGVSDAYE